LSALEVKTTVWSLPIFGGFQTVINFRQTLFLKSRSVLRFNQDNICFGVAARRNELFAVLRERESAKVAGFEIGDLFGRAAAEDWRLPEIHPLFI